MNFRVNGNTVRDLIEALERVDPDTKHCVDSVRVDHTPQGRKLRIALDETIPDFEDSVCHTIRPSPRTLQAVSNALEAHAEEVARQAEDALQEALRCYTGRVLREVAE